MGALIAIGAGIAVLTGIGAGVGIGIATGKDQQEPDPWLCTCRGNCNLWIYHWYSDRILLKISK